MSTTLDVWLNKGCIHHNLLMECQDICMNNDTDKCFSTIINLITIID